MWKILLKILSHFLEFPVIAGGHFLAGCCKCENAGCCELATTDCCSGLVSILQWFARHQMCLAAQSCRNCQVASRRRCRQHPAVCKSSASRPPTSARLPAWTHRSWNSVASTSSSELLGNLDRRQDAHCRRPRPLREGRRDTSRLSRTRISRGFLRWFHRTEYCPSQPVVGQCPQPTLCHAWRHKTERLCRRQSISGRRRRRHQWR